MSSDDENILDKDGTEDPKEVEGDIIDLEIDDLKVGVNFPTEESALMSIENWSFKSLCALAKIRYRKGKVVNGEKVKGRRCLACPHGIGRKKTGKGERPGQRVKNTNCPVLCMLN